VIPEEQLKMRLLNKRCMSWGGREGKPVSENGRGGIVYEEMTPAEG